MELLWIFLWMMTQTVQISTHTLWEKMLKNCQIDLFQIESHLSWISLFQMYTAIKWCNSRSINVMKIYEAMTSSCLLPMLWVSIALIYKHHQSKNFLIPEKTLTRKLQIFTNLKFSKYRKKIISLILLITRIFSGLVKIITIIIIKITKT